MVEYGVRGGDEVNVLEVGKNYGWLVIFYGCYYLGGKIGEGIEKLGMEQLVYYWDLFIVLFGMVFVSSEKYLGWQGDLLVGVL